MRRFYFFNAHLSLIFPDAAAGFRRTSNSTIDICDTSKSKFYASVGGSHIISTKKTNSVSEGKKSLIKVSVYL